MHSFFSKTAWSVLFLLGLMLPNLGLIEADFVASSRYDLSPSDRVSLKRLEVFFSRRIRSFSQEHNSLFAKHFLNICEYHRLDPVFVLSVIDVESRFRVHARSEMGALGLMQMMPETAQFISDDLDFRLSGLEKWPREKVEELLQVKDERALLDPFVNTALGISYLAWLRDHYDGSPFRLLAAYYVGPVRMDELLSRKSFKPVRIQVYYDSVRLRVPRIRKALHRANSSLECLVDLKKKGCYFEI